jgi:hypothetical protein
MEDTYGIFNDRDTQQILLNALDFTATSPVQMMGQYIGETLHVMDLQSIAA